MRVCVVVYTELRELGCVRVSVRWVVGTGLYAFVCALGCVRVCVHWAVYACVCTGLCMRVCALGCVRVCVHLTVQAPLRSIWEKYYESAHGVVFVVDSSDEGRFIEARNVLGALLSASVYTSVSWLPCACTVLLLLYVLVCQACFTDSLVHCPPCWLL